MAISVVASQRFEAERKDQVERLVTKLLPLSFDQLERKKKILTSTIQISPKNKELHKISFTLLEFCNFLKSKEVTINLSIGGGAARFILADHSFNDIDLYHSIKRLLFGEIEEVILEFFKLKLANPLEDGQIRENYIIKADSIFNHQGVPVGISHNLDTLDLNSLAGPEISGGLDDFRVLIFEDSFLCVNEQDKELVPLEIKLDRLKKKQAFITNPESCSRIYRRLTFLMTSGYYVHDLKQVNTIALRQLEKNYPNDRKEKIHSYFLTFLESHYPNRPLGKICYFLNQLFLIQACESVEIRHFFIEQFSIAWINGKIEPLKSFAKLLQKQPQLLPQCLIVIHGICLYEAYKNNQFISAYSSPDELEVRRFQFNLKDKELSYHLATAVDAHEVAENFFQCLESLEKEFGDEIVKLHKDLLFPQNPFEKRNFLSVFSEGLKNHSNYDNALRFHIFALQNLPFGNNRDLQTILFFLKWKKLYQEMPCHYKEIILAVKFLLQVNDPLNAKDLRKINDALKVLPLENGPLLKPLLNLVSDLIEFNPPNDLAALNEYYLFLKKIKEFHFENLDEKISQILTKIFKSLSPLIEKDSSDKSVYQALYILVNSSEVLRLSHGIWKHIFTLLRDKASSKKQVAIISSALLSHSKPSPECCRELLDLSEQLILEKEANTKHPPKEVGVHLMLSLAFHFKNIAWKEIRIAILKQFLHQDEFYFDCIRALENFEDIANEFKKPLQVMKEKKGPAFIAAFGILISLDLKVAEMTFRELKDHVDNKIILQAQIFLLFKQSENLTKENILSFVQKWLQIHTKKVKLKEYYIAAGIKLFDNLRIHYKNDSIQQMHIVEVLGSLLPLNGKALDQLITFNLVLSDSSEKTLLTLAEQLFTKLEPFLNEGQKLLFKSKLTQSHLATKTLPPLIRLEEYLETLFQKQEKECIEEILGIINLLLTQSTKNKESFLLAYKTFQKLIKAYVNGKFEIGYGKIFAEITHMLLEGNIERDKTRELCEIFVRVLPFLSIDDQLNIAKLFLGINDDLFLEVLNHLHLDKFNDGQLYTLHKSLCATQKERWLKIAFELFLSKGRFKLSFWTKFFENIYAIYNPAMFDLIVPKTLDILNHIEVPITEKMALSLMATELLKKIILSSDNAETNCKIKEYLLFIKMRCQTLFELQPDKSTLDKDYFSILHHFIEVLCKDNCKEKINEAFEIIDFLCKSNKADPLKLINSLLNIVESLSLLKKDEFGLFNKNKRFIHLVKQVFEYGLQSKTNDTTAIQQILTLIEQLHIHETTQIMAFQLFINFLNSIGIKEKKDTKKVRKVHLGTQLATTRRTFLIMVKTFKNLKVYSFINKLDCFASLLLQNDQQKNYQRDIQALLVENGTEIDQKELDEVKIKNLLKKSEKLLGLYAKYNPDIGRKHLKQLATKTLAINTGYALKISELALKAYRFKIYSKSSVHNHLSNKTRLEIFKERFQLEEKVCEALSKSLDEASVAMLVTRITLLATQDESWETEENLIDFANISIGTFDTLLLSFLNKEHLAYFDKFLHAIDRLFTLESYVNYVLTCTQGYILKLLTISTAIQQVSQKFQVATKGIAELNKKDFCNSLAASPFLSDLPIDQKKRVHLINTSFEMFLQLSEDKLIALGTEEMEKVLIDFAQRIFVKCVESSLFFNKEKNFRLHRLSELITFFKNIGLIGKLYISPLLRDHFQKFLDTKFLEVKPKESM